MLLDASNSLNQYEWKNEVKFATDLVKKFYIAPDKNHVGIVAFHQNPITYLDLVVGTNSTTVEEVLKTLGDNDKPGTELGKKAYTMTDKGLDTAYRMFKR